MMEGNREITVPSKADEIPVILDFIEETMRSSGFDMKKIMEVQLAAEEACTNIALYAYGEREGDIHIVARIGDGLHLTIEDRGTPFDPTKREAPAMKASAEERPVGGLGIYLIKNYVDEVSYEFKDGKNVLRLVKNKN